MVLLYKQPTNQATQRVIIPFPSAQAINDWNDGVDKSVSNVNTAKSFAIMFASLILPALKVLNGLPAVISAIAATSIDNKIILFTAKEGGLKVGDSLVTEVKSTTIRSTKNGTKHNGVRINISIHIENSSRQKIETLQEVKDFIELNPFEKSNGTYKKSIDRIFNIYETIQNSESIIDGKKSIPYLIKFKFRD